MKSNIIKRHLSRTEHSHAGKNPRGRPALKKPYMYSNIISFITPDDGRRNIAKLQIQEYSNRLIWFEFKLAFRNITDVF